MNKKPTSPVVAGLIISALLVVFAVVTAVFKLEQRSGLSLVPIVLMVAGIIWACINYSKELDGYVTFGNVFVHGFKASALIAGIMALFMILLFNFIMPEALDRAMDAARQKMESDQKMSEQDVNKNMAMAKKIALVTVPLVTAFIYLAVGVVSALIGAAVAKTNSNATPFDKTDQSAS